MMGHVSLHVHSSWESVLAPFSQQIKGILESIGSDEFTPNRDKIFAALQMDKGDVKCVILGQDPYQTKGSAQGLAFSVPADLKPLPPSLRNIFTELVDDLGVTQPTNGDLTPWRSQGVLLLNRILTTRVGESSAHLSLGWQQITTAICAAVAEDGAVGILWGKHAQQLSYLFQERIESPHPSPLSAYRGFFGSAPFSKVNNFLINSSKTPIDWTL